MAALATHSSSFDPSFQITTEAPFVSSFDFLINLDSAIFTRLLLIVGLVTAVACTSRHSCDVRS